MKVGDLVRLCELSYPQYRGKVGILVRWLTSPAPSTPWEVVINGKSHPYVVYQADMEVINESR